MGALKESVLLAIDDKKAQEAEGTSSHLIGARDRFSRRLAFQGPDIDPYLRYALQVDVANVMKELGELLGLEPPEAGTSQVASKIHPALPEDVENFDADGKVLWSLSFYWSLSLCGFVMCFGVCRFLEESGGLRDRESWPDCGIIMREGLCCVVSNCFCLLVLVLSLVLF